MSFVEDVLAKVTGPVVRGTLRWRWAQRVGEEAELTVYTNHRQDLALYNCTLAAFLEKGCEPQPRTGQGVKEMALKISGMQFEVGEQATRCRNCRSNNVGVVARQTRSADEGMTAKLVCHDCGNVRNL